MEATSRELLKNYMKKLLEFIISKIIDDDKDISVEEIKHENNAVSYTITSPKEKIGFLVGKNGRIIQAIRTVMKISAVKQNILLANIDIQEKQ